LKPRLAARYIASLVTEGQQSFAAQHDIRMMSQKQYACNCEKNSNKIKRRDGNWAVDRQPHPAEISLFLANIEYGIRSEK
jgi:hypothetical protein